MLLELETPADGATIGDPQRLALVSGRALAVQGDYRAFDIVFVVDTSRSTADPAGADIDGDGRVEPAETHDSVFGRMLALRPGASGDTILAAEIAAARRLLAQLDPRTTRVGVVTFAGDTDPLTPDAVLEAPLTADYERVDRALGGVLARGPQGMTNMVSGLDLAVAELERSEPRAGQARPLRIVLLMTDGQPTLPIENAQMQNTRMAIQRAARAGAADIRIDTYAIGPEALREPLVAVEMAAVSGGVFTPVVRPADLRSVFGEISFSEIESLTLRNRTNGARPGRILRNSDGSFSALLELAEGRNVIEVEARATDGTEGRRQVVVTWAAGAGEQELDARRLAQRTRLLEIRLLELRQHRLDQDAERDRRLLEALREEIARERKKAEQRAAERRKQLEIEALPH
jgi:Mg-chelatase subunit ChlD